MGRVRAGRGALACLSWGGLVVRVAGVWWDGGDVNGSAGEGVSGDTGCWDILRGPCATPREERAPLLAVSASQPWCCTPWGSAVLCQGWQRVDPCRDPERE